MNSMLRPCHRLIPYVSSQTLTFINSISCFELNCITPHAAAAAIHWMLFVLLQKRIRVKKELTFQDMYQNQDLFDQDDDEDDDWDPSQKQADDGVGQTAVSDSIDEVSEANPQPNAVSVFSNYWSFVYFISMCVQDQGLNCTVIVSRCLILWKIVVSLKLMCLQFCLFI